MLRGPGFDDAWAWITASVFRTEEVAPDVRDFVLATSRPRQETVLGYWQDLFERTTPELALEHPADVVLPVLGVRTKPRATDGIADQEHPDLDVIHLDYGEGEAEAVVRAFRSIWHVMEDEARRHASIVASSPRRVRAERPEREG